jgi:hypothetical protein
VGTWTEIRPTNLPEKDDHCWLFAVYVESPSERDDGHWYQALLFRSKDRTVFGRKEYDYLVHFSKLRSLARRVVAEEELKASLLSDDPDLPKLWKRR